jgi:hypothetical protein
MIDDSLESILGDIARRLDVLAERALQTMLSPRDLGLRRAPAPRESSASSDDARALDARGAS